MVCVDLKLIPTLTLISLRGFSIMGYRKSPLTAKIAKALRRVRKEINLNGLSLCALRKAFAYFAVNGS